MMLQELADKIKQVEERVMAFPMDVDDNREKEFLLDLKNLLHRVEALDKDEKKEIYPRIKNLADQISRRINEMEAEMKLMQSEIENTELRQRTIKAYYKGRIF